MAEARDEQQFVQNKAQNLFVNDGSFMERFKKQLEGTKPEKVDSDYDTAPGVAQHRTGSGSSDGETERTESSSLSPEPAPLRAGTESFSTTSRLKMSYCQALDSKDERNSKGNKDEEHNVIGIGNTNTSSAASAKKATNLSFIGKRRGKTPVLKTGAVTKKGRKEDQIKLKESSGSGDAWALYMAEVERYSSNTCQEEDRSRPLVK